MRNEETLAYLAGFFDGEGCVGVYPHYDGRPKVANQVRVSVAQAAFALEVGA